MKKIVFFNQYYRPLANPPAKRLSAFAEYFVKQKWNVKVITGEPNSPTGKLRPGYTCLFKKEKINGVKVHRFPEIPLKNEGFWKRMINYASFTLSSTLSFPLLFGADVVFISSPPLFSAIPIFYLARLFRRKIVLDIRDLWPESAVAVVNAKQGLLYKWLLRISNKMYKKSDFIIVTSNQTRKILQKRTKTKVITITNFSETKNQINKKLEFDKIHITFTGLLSKAQNLSSFLEINKHEDIRKKFEWHIVGDGEDLINIQNLIHKNNFKNIHLYGYQSKSFCDDKISSADVCFSTLEEFEVFKSVLPSKCLEYLSHGKPILMNWSLEVKDIIEKNDCGYFINSKKDLKNTLLSIKKEDLRLKSKNARKTFDNNFEKNHVCEKLFEVLINEKN